VLTAGSGDGRRYAPNRLGGPPMGVSQRIAGEEYPPHQARRHKQMKATSNVWSRLAYSALAGTLICMASCTLSSDKHSKKFGEEQFANLIIRYSTDETIYLIKPDAHEGEFFRIFDRNQIYAEAEKIGGPRLLAVVLIDYMYGTHVEHEIIDGWAASFKELNFERVVFLRSHNHHSPNGLRIIADVQLAKSAAADSGRTSLSSL